MKLTTRERAWIVKNARPWFAFLGAEYMMDFLEIVELGEEEGANVFACADASALWGRCVLSISLVWWRRFNAEQKREILVHEICHLVQNGSFFTAKDKTHHGPEWRKLMRKCGYYPRARYAWEFPDVQYQRAA